MAKKSEEIKTSVKCFTITVDGKKYGPFTDEHRSKIAYLANSAGISIETVWLKEGWVVFCTPPPRQKKDKTTPLLEGIGFTPISKQTVNMGFKASEAAQ